MTHAQLSRVVDLDALDLADPRTYIDHDLAQLWRQIRSDDPVYWNRPAAGRPGFWAVSRYHDNQAIYRDSRRFSTERGNMLATLLHGGDSAGGKMISVTDGPRHKDLRGLIVRAFSQRALEIVVERVREFTHRILADAVRAGGCDFAKDIGARVPINTICELLGVPPSDRDYLLSLNKRAVSSDEAGQQEQHARLARTEIVMYFADLVERRRRSPSDDVVGVLAGTKVDGEYLSSHDIVLNCYSLLLGGDETSRFSMISAVHALATFKDQWLGLRRGDVELPVAIEEIVRWSTPIMHIGRVALADVEIGGKLIRTGDVVTLWNTSANRDEEVFAAPDTFDLGRNPNKHLAFGFGVHFCIGVFLARAEIGALLEGLRMFAADIEIAGPPQPIYSNVLNGYSSLPVTFLPAS
jgi:cytochrome P450